MSKLSKIQTMERKICRRVIADALKAGYRISVHDGEEFVLIKSTNTADISRVMFSTDEDVLYFYHSDDPKKCRGFVHFVYGNCGHDVISDYSDSLEPVFHTAKQIADAMQ